MQKSEKSLKNSNIAVSFVFGYTIDKFKQIYSLCRQIYYEEKYICFIYYRRKFIEVERKRGHL